MNTSKYKMAVAAAVLFGVAANAQLLEEYMDKGDNTVRKTFTKEDRMSSKVKKFVKDQKEKKQNKQVRKVTTKADLLGRKGKKNGVDATTTYLVDDSANEKLEVWVARSNVNLIDGDDEILQVNANEKGNSSYWVNGKKVNQKKFNKESEKWYKNHLNKVQNGAFVERRNLDADEIESLLSSSENTMVVEKPEITHDLSYDLYENGVKLPYQTVSPDVMNKFNGIYDLATQKGNKGANIGINVIESGCPATKYMLDPDYVSGICYSNTDPDDVHHGALVLGVVQSVAPQAEITIRNDGDHYPIDFTLTGAVINNRSYGFNTTEALGDTYNDYDQMLDDYIYTYRTADFVSAGNYISAQKGKYVTSPAKALNAFAVGAANPIYRNDYDLSFSVADYSDYINPDTKNDKPEFLNITGLWLDHLKNFPCSNCGMPAYFPGTSSSSPYTAATAALFMKRYPVLKGRPAVLKALMLASSMIPTQNGSSYDSDNHFTNGLPMYRYTESSNTQIRSWDMRNGSLFTSSNKDFSFTESNVKANKRYRAAISWLSSGSAVKSCGHVPQDIDLRVYQGDKLLAKSTSYHNPFEVVSFKTTSTSDLTIKIRRDSNCDANERIIMGYSLVQLD